jgi:large subunit ribosomal protein L6
MSRIGKLPIAVPKGVTITINKGDVTIKGPKGELKRSFNPDMMISLKDATLVVERPDDAREHRALHGLYRTLLFNMVTGVTTGFETTLEISGVGYRAENAGGKLNLRVGYSHLVEVPPVTGVALALEGTNKIKVQGIDKELVGQTAAKIRALRPADDYKGKGIKYAGETIKLKAGKAGKAIGGKK